MPALDGSGDGSALEARGGRRGDRRAAGPARPAGARRRGRRPGWSTTPTLRPKRADARRRRRREAELSPPSPTGLDGRLPRARDETAAARRTSERRPARRTATGSSPTCTCTRTGRTTARSRSTTCSTTPRRIGLGAIAVTDHNVFGGALEAVERARNRRITVIPGEEIKTDGQGEVIGLFLKEEIPRGLSFADTVAAIRAQGALVYVPHPFDRMHAIADPSTLHRHLAEIDVFETYNARLLFETYNDEALRFARKYNLTMGAGSDAHVLQGVGTGCRADAPVQRPGGVPRHRCRNAEILRRPKSLAYLQGLKWVAQVKERVR